MSPPPAGGSCRTRRARRRHAPRSRSGRRLEEARPRRAELDHLSRALLGDAGPAARGIGVRDGAAAEDRPRREAARLRDVADEVVEGEVHLAGVDVADLRAVPAHREAQVEAPAAPGGPELVGRDRERRERRRRLRLEEAEALGELGRHEVAVGDVVREAQEPHVALGVLRGGAAGHVAEHDADLRLEVHAPRRIGERDVLAGREQHAGAALVDERVRLERRRRLRAARPAHEPHVVQVGGAVHPLVGARQRREQAPRVERLDAHPPRLDRLGEGPEPGLTRLPAVERVLQRRRDAGRFGERLAIPAHHHEPAVAAPVT